MKALIIEDEKPAARRLENILQQLDVEVIAKKECVESATDWLLKNQKQIDIIFSDIQLENGTSFEVFETVQTNVPIIFTTAYSEFALKAFEVNSVDYLLKPFAVSAVKNALEKYKKKFTPKDNIEKINALINDLKGKKNYKTRFLKSVGTNISIVSIKEIDLFFSEEKMLYAFLKDGSKEFLDGTLEQVLKELDPKKFFQINRKCIISCDAIHQMTSYKNSRIKINVKYFNFFDLIVARQRVKHFKNWLEEKQPV